LSYGLERLHIAGDTQYNLAPQLFLTEPGIHPVFCHALAHNCNMPAFEEGFEPLQPRRQRVSAADNGNLGVFEQRLTMESRDFIGGAGNQ